MRLQSNIIEDLEKKLNLRYDEQNCMWFDKILTIGQRSLSYFFVKIIKSTNITPNQITISRIIYFPIMFYFFSQGSYLNNILGFVTLLIYTLLDTIDGDLARSKKITTDLGAWMDHTFDKLMVNVVLSSVALGAYNVTNNPSFLIYGFIALFLQAMLINISNDYFQLFGENIFFNAKIKKHIDSDKKSTFFDKILVNMFIFNSFWTYFFFTIRYQIIIGVIFGVLKYMVFYWVFALGIRLIFLFLVLFLYMNYNDKSRFKLINLLQNKSYL